MSSIAGYTACMPACAVSLWPTASPCNVICCVQALRDYILADRPFMGICLGMQARRVAG